VAIKENMQESRREWMLWMMERAGKKNSNNTNFQFWQQHNQPLEVKDHKMFNNCLEYIHMNPVSAGFVSRAEDWIYSSASGYSENSGLLKLHYP
jgi:ABC-type transporter lipoprotein component MlaA